MISLGEVCWHGDIESVKSAIIHGAKDWNDGLINSCIKGYNEIAKLMIDCGAKYVNEGLSIACERGHVETAKLMIDRGATNVDEGMLYAIGEIGYIEIVRLMIKHGATDWNGGLRFACSYGHTDIAFLMIENGANIDNCIINDDHIRYLMERGFSSFRKYTSQADALRSKLNKLIIEQINDVHIFPEFFHLVNAYKLGPYAASAAALPKTPAQ